MKAPLNTYVIETSFGPLDIIQLYNNKKEREILNELRKDLLLRGEFKEHKVGTVDYASLAAFIIYCSSIEEIVTCYGVSDKAN